MTTGTRIRTATAAIVAGLGLALLGEAVTARADEVAFYVTHNRANPAGGGTYGTIDLDTGVTATLGAFTPPCCGGSEGYDGLGVVNGQLYTATYYSANTPDSALVHIANPGAPLSSSSLVSPDSGHGFYDFGSTRTALYALDAQGNLLSVNALTGQASLVRATGLTLGNSGMSAGGDTLYVTDRSVLYSINTTSGLATEVGSTGDYRVLAMVVEGGRLYGTAKNRSDGHDYVAQIDPTSGALSDIRPISGDLPVTTDRIWGLADVPTAVVPAPAAAGLLAFAVSWLALVRGRRRG